MTDHTTKQVAKSLADAPHTRIYDAIVKEVGDTSSEIFGVVFRHSLMRKGICYATKETMAQIVGCSRSTFIRHLNKLVENGYLVDHTPDEKFRPHGYTIGAKAIDTLQNSVSPCTDSVSPCTDSVSQRHTQCVTMIHKESIKNQIGINKEGTATPRAATSSFSSSKNYMDIIIQFYRMKYDLVHYWIEQGKKVDEADTAMTQLLEDMGRWALEGDVVYPGDLFDDVTFEEWAIYAYENDVAVSFIADYFEKAEIPILEKVDA